MNPHDPHQLDERLRDVPVPAGLARRVAAQELFDDAVIDRLLAAVESPAGIAERVRRAASSAGDAGPGRRSLTAQPPAPRAASRPAAGRPAWAAGWRRCWHAAADLIADGAAVATALAIVALMFLAGMELSRRLAPSTPGAPPVLVGRGSSPTGAGRGAADVRSPADVAAARARAGEDRPVRDGSRGPLESVAGPPHDAVAESGSAANPAGGGPSPSPAPSGAGAPVEVRAAPVAAPGDAFRKGALQGIRAVQQPQTSRLLPRSPAFDIAFEMAHGESPFIDPSHGPEVAVDRPPWSLRTDSFDALCDVARQDRKRPGVRRSRRAGLAPVRTEEILAALPAPPAAAAAGQRGLSLSLEAVRSLRASPDSLLVEVAVTAPALADPTAVAPAALDCLLVLDQSAGPFASLSWPWLCRGLERVVGQMRPADRLSLVVCGETSRLVALRADAAALARLLPELAKEPAASSSDVDAAFRLAAAVSGREGDPRQIVAVVHAGSMDRCRREGRAALAGWQATRAGGVPSGDAPALEFLLIDAQEPVSSGTVANAGMTEASGRVPLDGIAIGRAMLGKVFNRPTLVATGGRLDVAFDPARVAGYRIIGHRQTVPESLAAPLPGGLELHAGETARVVYEVIRRAGGPSRQSGLVSAVLEWSPAEPAPEGVGPTRQVRAGLRDGVDPALAAGLPPPHGCELVLAVALGELAAASVHAEPWRRFATGVAGLVSRWRSRGDVTPTGHLLIGCLESQGIIAEIDGR